MHISKKVPTENSTKIWITKAGGCIIADNHSNIPEKDLKELLEVIENNYFVIIDKWKKHFVTKTIKFYC